VVGVVSRSDLLQILARDDDEIAGDLRTALVAELGPHHDVSAEVSGGVVTLASGGGVDLAAAALVATRVPGVVRVSTSAER
jgi:hypothetical protein